MSEALSPEGLKTLTVQPRGNRPATWTIVDQVALDEQAKAEERTRRAQKLAERQPPRMLKA